MADVIQPADHAAFRRMYSNFVKSQTGGRLVLSPDKQDNWIILRRPTLTYIHVIHKIDHHAVDLALFDYNFNYVGTAIPPDAVDVSTGKTRMFRWPNEPVKWDQHPTTQEGVKQAIKRALDCFNWVEKNKVIQKK